MITDSKKMEAKAPRAIALEDKDTLQDIIKNSSCSDGSPRTLLVWRKDGGWDLYGVPGVKPKEAEGNAPVPPDANLDPSKMQVESITAVRNSPGCYLINGRWYWT